MHLCFFSQRCCVYPSLHCSLCQSRIHLFYQISTRSLHQLSILLLSPPSSHTIIHLYTLWAIHSPILWAIYLVSPSATHPFISSAFHPSSLSAIHLYASSAVHPFTLSAMHPSSPIGTTLSILSAIHLSTLLTIHSSSPSATHLSTYICISSLPAMHLSALASIHSLIHPSTLQATHSLVLSHAIYSLYQPIISVYSSDQPSTQYIFVEYLLSARNNYTHLVLHV